MKADLTDIITSRGYWRVNFEPTGEPKALSLSEADKLVADNTVKLRGWYYPFYAHGTADNRGVENQNGYVQGWIDSGEYKEFWRMYTSSQFLHYSVVHEDWWTPEVLKERFSTVDEVAPGSFLNFVGSLNYYVTEIMEFLSRLHRSGLYQEGVTVNISLNNTEGRALTSFDFFRHLSFPRVTHAESIKFSKTYEPRDLDQSPQDLAIEPLLYFYELFNFADVSVESVIKKDQETLYGYTGK